MEVEERYKKLKTKYDNMMAHDHPSPQVQVRGRTGGWAAVRVRGQTCGVVLPAPPDMADALDSHSLTHTRCLASRLSCVHTASLGRTHAHTA